MRHSAFALAAAILFLSLPSYSYFSFMDTGDLLGRGNHRAQGETQYILDEPLDGVNLNGRFSTGLNEESDLQVEAGFGSVDFSVAGFWKWVPFPDTPNQPAVGGRFGLTYGKFGDISTYGFQFTPFISKKWNIGGNHTLTPYFALPIGLQNSTEATTVSLQGILGTHYTHPDLRNVHFLVEFAFEFDDAFDHVSAAVSFDI